MLKSYHLLGKTVATIFGDITFDQNGESRDLSPEKEKELSSKVASIELVSEPKAKEAPKKVNTSKEEKTAEKAKEEPKKATKKTVKKDKE